MIFEGMEIVGFRGICGIGDRAGEWLRYKVFGVFGKIRFGWDSRNFRGFESGFL